MSGGACQGDPTPHKALHLTFRAEYGEAAGELRNAKADLETLEDRCKHLQDQLDKARASADIHKRAYDALKVDYDRTCRELARAKSKTAPRRR